MNDHHDPETAQDYDRLRDSVVATTDVETSLGDLHDRVGVGRGSRRRWAGVVGAAAAVALVAGAAFVVTRTDSTDVTAAAGGPVAPSATASSTPDDTAVPPVADECPTNTFIYLVPEASTEQVQGMQAMLESLDLEPYEFLDREATAEEFRRLFADQPDFVAAVDPSELPQSFRLPETLPPQTITAIEGTPGVLRIESSDETCASSDPASADTATTTPIAGG